MDFRDALNNVIADLTPQPWDYTTPDGQTLTVIPAGLRETPGQAEVYVRATASKTMAAQAAIRTTDMPALIAFLGAPVDRVWEHQPHWADGTRMRRVGHWLGDDSGLSITPAPGGRFMVTAIEDTGDGIVSVSVVLPEAQRLPLASALQRALDVALSWEH